MSGLATRANKKNTALNDPLPFKIKITKCNTDSKRSTILSNILKGKGPINWSTFLVNS